MNPRLNEKPRDVHHYCTLMAYRMCGEVGESELKSEKIEIQERKALASFGIRSGVGMNLATKVWL